MNKDTERTTVDARLGEPRLAGRHRSTDRQLDTDGAPPYARVLDTTCEFLKWASAMLMAFFYEAKLAQGTVLDIAIFGLGLLCSLIAIYHYLRLVQALIAWQGDVF